MLVSCSHFDRGIKDPGVICPETDTMVHRPGGTRIDPPPINTLRVKHDAGTLNSDKEAIKFEH